MNNLPRVTVRPFDNGWVGVCDRCGWQLWHACRPAVDLEAEEHRSMHVQIARRKEGR